MGATVHLCLCVCVPDRCVCDLRISVYVCVYLCVSLCAQTSLSGTKMEQRLNGATVHLCFCVCMPTCVSLCICVFLCVSVCICVHADRSRWYEGGAGVAGSNSCQMGSV